MAFQASFTQTQWRLKFKNVVVSSKMGFSNRESEALELLSLAVKSLDFGNMLYEKSYEDFI